MISSQTRRTQVTLSGSGQTISVPWYYLAEADLTVISTDTDGVDTTLVLNTDYTVTGEGVEAGGTVTRVAGTSGDIITVYGAAGLTQPYDLANYSQLSYSALERAYDRLTMLIQQISDKVARSLRVPLSNAAINPMTKTERASTVLSFNSNGDLELVAIDDTWAGSTNSLVTATGSITPRTLGNRFADALNVKDFGATGDGTTDDTTAFQAAIDYCISSGMSLSLTRDTFVCGALTVYGPLVIYGNGATISLVGADAVDQQWIEFTASFTGFEISDLSIVGDGDYNSHQIGFGPTNSGVVVTRVRVTNVNISQVAIGIDASAMVDCQITGGTIGPVVGNAPGLGYGIDFGTGSTGCLVQGVRFYRCTRHSLYIASCLGASVVNCQFIQHGYSQTPTSGSALVVARGNNTAISGCIFRDCISYPIEIADDNALAGSCDATAFAGCSFYNNNKAIIIGTANTETTDSNTSSVSFIGCSFFVPALNDGVFLIYTANIIVISGCSFNFVTNTTGQIGITIYGTDADTPRNCLITNNTVSLTGSGAIRCFVYLNTPICASSATASVQIKGNFVTGGDLFVAAAALQNAGIITDTATALTISGATPYVSGYNRFVLSNGGATTVTDFLGGYDGQRISVYFNNGNSTLSNAMYLAGAVNFAGTQYDQITLENQAGGWHEICRSVN